MQMTAANKALKTRYALIEVMGDLNQQGRFKQAVKLEEAINACPDESLVKLFDIVMDASYDPLGTLGKEG